MPATLRSSAQYPSSPRRLANYTIVALLHGMGALIPKLTNRCEAGLDQAVLPGPSGRSLLRGSPSLGNSPISLPSVIGTFAFSAAIPRLDPGRSTERDEVVFGEVKVIARGRAIVGQTMPWDR